MRRMGVWYLPSTELYPLSRLRERGEGLLKIARDAQPEHARLHGHDVRLRTAHGRRAFGVPRKLTAIVERVLEEHVEAPQILFHAGREIERTVARHVAHD